MSSILPLWDALFSVKPDHSFWAQLISTWDAFLNNSAHTTKSLLGTIGPPITAYTTGRLGWTSPRAEFPLCLCSAYRVVSVEWVLCTFPAFIECVHESGTALSTGNVAVYKTEQGPASHSAKILVCVQVDDIQNSQ